MKISNYQEMDTLLQNPKHEISKNIEQYGKIKNKNLINKRG